MPYHMIVVGTLRVRPIANGASDFLMILNVRIIGFVLIVRAMA